MRLNISGKMLKKFKGFCSSPEIIMLLVYMKCRFSLSYRELEEIAFIRGAAIDHSTIARWVLRFTPLIDKMIRKRKKPVGSSWRMDETYIKVNGQWVYLYRSVDSLGNTVDYLLRQNRDKAAAKAFFKKAFKNNGTLEKINIDKRGSNTAALSDINGELPEDAEMIEIRRNKYMNNIVEQDHRFVKKRTSPILGFKSFSTAEITVSEIESIRMIQKAQVEGADADSFVFENFCTVLAA